jgi:hypothetical protein
MPISSIRTEPLPSKEQCAERSYEFVVETPSSTHISIRVLDGVLESKLALETGITRGCLYENTIRDMVSRAKSHVRALENVLASDPNADNAILVPQRENGTERGFRIRRK